MALSPVPESRRALNGLALFAGGAGLELGLSRFLAGLGRASRTVCFVEREAYAASVLVSRMEEGRLDPAPVWDDVQTFDGRPWRGVVDYIAGGFPCQDISNAGGREGILDGEKSGLWREYARLVGEVRPRFVFVENVRPLLVRGIDVVLGDLAALGFAGEWLHLRASDVGAPHGRDRLFLLAYARGNAVRVESERDQREGRGERAAERGDAEPRESGEALGDAGRAERRSNDDAGGRGEQRRDGGGEKTGRPRESSGVVGDPGGAGLEGAERSGQPARNGARSRAAEQPGGDVADAARGGTVPEEQSRRGGGALASGAIVADAGGDGLLRSGARHDDDGRDASGHEPHGCDAGLGSRGPTEWRDAGGRLRFWPPGPRDAEGWWLYLRAHPSRAPAVDKARAQSGFRGGADGVAEEMVLRVDRLRLLGNGVVPFQAAAAFRLLAARRPEIEDALRFD